MDVFEAIQERRSVRRYTGEELGREQVERVLEAGRWAPSAKNRQPWRFVVLGGEHKAQAVAVMEQGIRRERERPLLPGSARMLPGAVNTARIMEQAPVVVLVVNPLEEAMALPGDKEADFFHLANAQSVGAAIQNMALAAHGLGLGSLWICDIDFAYPELCEWLGDRGQLLAALALGVPGEQPSRRPRKGLEALVEWRW